MKIETVIVLTLLIGMATTTFVSFYSDIMTSYDVSYDDENLDAIMGNAEKIREKGEDLRASIESQGLDDNLFGWTLSALPQVFSIIIESFQFMYNIVKAMVAGFRLPGYVITFTTSIVVISALFALIRFIMGREGG
ncbi:MAG: hypothetical protein ACTSR2_01115 [Candidatus Hodarchaeales archaeon]